MSKGSLILVLGLVMAFVPFLGIPEGAKAFFLVIFGLTAAGLGFLVREERIWLMRALQGEHKTDAFAETNPHHSSAQ